MQLFWKRLFNIQMGLLRRIRWTFLKFMGKTLATNWATCALFKERKKKVSLICLLFLHIAIIATACCCLSYCCCCHSSAAVAATVVAIVLLLLLLLFSICYCCCYCSATVVAIITSARRLCFRKGWKVCGRVVPLNGWTKDQPIKFWLNLVEHWLKI